MRLTIGPRTTCESRPSLLQSADAIVLLGIGLITPLKSVLCASIRGCLTGALDRTVSLAVRV